MYRKGDLKLTLQPCEHKTCNDLSCFEDPSGLRKILPDSRQDGAQMVGAFLPHSCQEWVIGGINELDALIDDAQAAILELQRRGPV